MWQHGAWCYDGNGTCGCKNGTAGSVLPLPATPDLNTSGSIVAPTS